MKVSLKRIEATLYDLERVSASKTGNHPRRPLSFRISVKTQLPETSAPSSSKEEEGADSDFFVKHISVQTFPARAREREFSNRLKFKHPSFKNYHYGVNPALAINLLREIQTDIAQWQEELQIIVRQIQDIYLEGPIVNGWLESYKRESETQGMATLRHGEVERLMNYVEEICADQEKISYQLSRTCYRLCALDSAGKVWSRPCPTEQVPSVSMALARYQKLRQLLGRKQSLENGLSQLAETLTTLHGHLQKLEPDKEREKN
ncbi:FIG00874514: hypothetical protein [Richelia intracellularis HH01]|uniref:Uncharacterized protein n=1 Tax=Richelia intracellularis HH01 TaxID=1165094 RepID=M1WYH0_9NOST|nr:hypothetical protein [Richelia intracellularis]CCH66862.1 FIG00874514: hypothetical protein [Richelia intracellularis HH01]